MTIAVYKKNRPWSDFVRSSCRIQFSQELAGNRRGEPMNSVDQSEIADQIDEAALAEVMRVTPLGAGVARRNGGRFAGAWLSGDLSAGLPAARPGGLAP